MLTPSCHIKNREVAREADSAYPVSTLQLNSSPDNSFNADNIPLYLKPVDNYQWIQSRPFSNESDKPALLRLSLCPNQSQPELETQSAGL
jgi:hypothetical protein